MAVFKREQIQGWFEELKAGEISPDHMVQGEFGEQTLLHALLNSEIPKSKQFWYLKQFIEEGCDVDKFASFSTPISLAASGVASGVNNISLVEYMLEYHQKGHRSDLNIIKAAVDSLDVGMFEAVLESGKIDTNVTQMGSHILHHLADVEGYDDTIKKLFELAQDTNPNPIHRNGASPLTIALNAGMEKNALQLAVFGGKIIGRLEAAILAIDLGMVSDYDGEFWNDFPETLGYALENGSDEIPEEIKDVFLF